MTSLVLLDISSYLFCALTIGLINMPPASTGENKNTSKVGASWITFWQEVREGFQLTRQDSLIATLLIVEALTAFAQGIILVLLVVFVKEILKGSARELGWILTAQGIGGLIGALLTGYISLWVQPVYLVALGSGGSGLLFLIMINLPVFPLLLPGMVVAGALIVSWIISEQILLQNRVDDRYRGRVFGVYGALYGLLTLTGMGLASTLGDLLGVLPVLDLAGILFTVAGVIALVRLPNQCLSS